MPAINAFNAQPTFGAANAKAARKQTPANTTSGFMRESFEAIAHVGFAGFGKPAAAAPGRMKPYLA